MKNSSLIYSAVLLGAAWALASTAAAQAPKSGLTDADRAYRMPDGVTAKDVKYWSENVACYGKIFFPKGFDVSKKSVGVVLCPGWAGTSSDVEKYAARMAEKGLVAMAIDYRGWGKSGGEAKLAERLYQDDRRRFHPEVAKITIKRTRILPEAQIEDIRNAISYLQGEPGLDREKIGLWGTSFGGGHVIAVASRDARVKAGVAHLPRIDGKDQPESQAVVLKGDALADAIQRARTGKGDTFETGDSAKRTVDVETRQAIAEYLPFHSVQDVPTTCAILLVTAEKDEAVKNQDHAVAADKLLKGPHKLMELPGVTHYQAHLGDAFEKGANASADWLIENLK